MHSKKEKRKEEEKLGMITPSPASLSSLTSALTACSLNS
jgi:hypothetical protein